MVSSGQIAITPADKGGSVLIVDPKMLRNRTLEKLENPRLYQKLDADPLHSLHGELFDTWVEGKTRGFVTPDEAKSVMGVSDNLDKSGKGPTNRPSTAPHHKPGKSYFYPSLKVHKLSKDQLVPGIEPPVRLITALQEGISKKSDVFFSVKLLDMISHDHDNLSVLTNSLYAQVKIF